METQPHEVISVTSKLQMKCQLTKTQRVQFTTFAWGAGRRATDAGLRCGLGFSGIPMPLGNGR